MSAPHRPGFDDHGGPSSSRGPPRKTLLGAPGPEKTKPMRGLPRSYPPPCIDDPVSHPSGEHNGIAAAGTSNGESTASATAPRVRRKLPPTPPAVFYMPEAAPSPCFRMIPPVDISQLGPEHLRNLNDRFRCVSCSDGADYCDHLGYNRLPPSMRSLVSLPPDTSKAGEKYPNFPFIDPEVQNLMNHHWRTTERIRDDVLPRFEKLREKYGFAPSMTSVRRPTINFPKHMIEEGQAIIMQEAMERSAPAIAKPMSTAGIVPPAAVQNGNVRQRNPAGAGHVVDPPDVITLTPPPEDPVSKPAVKRKPASKQKKHRKHK